MKTRITIIFCCFILLSNNNIYSQTSNNKQKDTVDYYQDKIISGNHKKNEVIGLNKNREIEMFNEIRISPLKNKLVLTKSTSENDTHILWLIDLQTEHAVILAMSLDNDLGIQHPLWSPDGKWIAFASYSKSGHSPLTTTQTWIIDTSGIQLQHVVLPGNYGKFSNEAVSWESNHLLIILGTELQSDNGAWNEKKEKFIYDCETKLFELVK